MIDFTHRNKLYVADCQDTGLYMCATVCENESVYTREEVRKAQQAYELVRAAGSPSPTEVLHLVQDGNIRGMPALSRADIERAYRIYGTHPEYICGQLTSH